MFSEQMAKYAIQLLEFKASPKRLINTNIYYERYFTDNNQIKLQEIIEKIVGYEMRREICYIFKIPLLVAGMRSNR